MKLAHARPSLALPLAVGAIQIVGTMLAARNQPDRESLDLLGYALLLAGPAALLVRFRHPVPVLAFVAGVTFTYLQLGYPYGPYFVSTVVAFLTAVVEGHRRAAWVIAGLGYAAFLLLGYAEVGGSRPTVPHAAAVASWLLVVLVVGEVIRVRAERAAEADRAREEETRRKTGEERMRIARELHDVLAHNISLINVQAGVALHLIDEQPEQARTALTAIKQVSKDALGELRSVLDVLRQGDESAPRSPTPSLAGLDELVDRAGSAGLTVRVEILGRPRPLPASVDLAAFRIVQEALTNVTRHVGPAAATVRIGYADTELTVQIDDDGGTWALVGGARPRDRAAELPSGGSGLRGMRERAAAVGGQVSAGPRDGGGFSVRARLPLEDGQ